MTGGTISIRAGRLTSLAVLVAAVVIAGSVSLLLGKDANFDLLNYHYYNGYAFLYGRMGQDLAPAQLQSYLNPLLDVPVYLGISLLPPKVYGFLLGGLHGVGIWLTYMVAAKVVPGGWAKSPVPLALLVAVTSFFGAGWLSEVGTAMGDNVIAILVLGALALVLSQPLPLGRESAPQLAAAGLLLGIATGLKLVAAVYAIALLAALPFLVEKRHAVMQCAVCLCGLCAGMAASIGFWMAKLWELFRNPLFPFYNGIFRSPYYQFANFRADNYFPRTLAEQLAYPFYFVLNPYRVAEAFFIDLRMVFLYLSLVVFSLWVLVRWLKDGRLGVLLDGHRKAFFVVTFCMVSYLAWQKTFSIYRYLIPLEMLVPVAAVIVAGAVMKERLFGRNAIIALLGFLIVTSRPIDWGRRPWTAGKPGAEPFFSIEGKGSLSNYGNATILMAGEGPTSYIIPSFPASTRFVRIEGNLYAHGMTAPMREEVARAISGSRDLRLLVSSPADLKAAAALDVSTDLTACDTITSSVGESYKLCPASAGE